MCTKETANKGHLCTKCIDAGHKRCDRQKRLDHVGVTDPYAYKGHRSVVNEEKFGLKARDE
jgi:hypothetical protein